MRCSNRARIKASLDSFRKHHAGHGGSFFPSVTRKETKTNDP